MAEIDVVDVSKVYGTRGNQVTAVSNLSYTVHDKEFVTLLGPSGCGKSTTLNMVAGLEGISSGEIYIGGSPVSGVEPGRRDLAFVFQDYALYPHMTLYDNIAFGLRMRKVDKSQIDTRVRQAADRVGIATLLDRKPRDLSGGQRQRVAVARAIARRPAIFLFDEPLSNLDALLRDQTRAELKRLHQELEATSLYVTHDQEEAMTLSDRIVVMSDGRLEQIGTPEEIYHQPSTEFVAYFVGKPHMNLYTAQRSEHRRYAVPGASISLDIALHGVPEQIRVGVRPEECELVSPDEDADATGTVLAVDPIGNASDVTIRCGDELLAVRVPGFADLSIGRPVGVSFRKAGIHAFRPGSGERIAPQVP